MLVFLGIEISKILRYQFWESIPFRAQDLCLNWGSLPFSLWDPTMSNRPEVSSSLEIVRSHNENGTPSQLKELTLSSQKCFILLFHSPFSITLFPVIKIDSSQESWSQFHEYNFSIVDEISWDFTNKWPQFLEYVR